MTPPGLQDFVRERYVLLTSYRRDGSPVRTPVNLAVEAGRGYLRTYDQALKVKRMRRNPEVTIAPATLRGRPTGPALRARARLLDPGSAEARHAARAIDRKHRVTQGVLVHVVHRFRGYRTLHYELRPLET